MTNFPSNILPFPIRHASIQTASQPTPAGPAIPCLPLPGHERLVSDDAYRDHVACVIGVAIRAGRREGRSLSSLQPQLRKWLIEFCDEGDPSAIMVRDWLTGDRHYLAADVDQGQAQWPRMVEHGVESGEGL